MGLTFWTEVFLEETLAIVRIVRRRSNEKNNEVKLDQTEEGRGSEANDLPGTDAKRKKKESI